MTTTVELASLGLQVELRCCNSLDQAGWNFRGAVQPIGGQGFFGCMERFASRLLLQSWIIQLVYVDDLQLAAAKFRKFGYLAVPNHLRKSWDIWEISIYTLKKDSCHYEHLQYHGNLKAPRPMPNPHPPAP